MRSVAGHSADRLRYRAQLQRQHRRAGIPGRSDRTCLGQRSWRKGLCARLRLPPRHHRRRRGCSGDRCRFGRRAQPDRSRLVRLCARSRRAAVPVRGRESRHQPKDAAGSAGLQRDEPAAAAGTGPAGAFVWDLRQRVRAFGGDAGASFLHAEFGGRGPGVPSASHPRRNPRGVPGSRRGVRRDARDAGGGFFAAGRAGRADAS